MQSEFPNTYLNSIETYHWRTWMSCSKVLLMLFSWHIKDKEGIARYYDTRMSEELTGWCELVARLDYRSLTDGNWLGRWNRFTSWNFVGEDLFGQPSAAAPGLLFCHLIVTRVEVFLALLQSFLKERWVSTGSTKAPDCLWIFGLKFLFLLFFDFLRILLKQESYYCWLGLESQGDER